MRTGWGRLAAQAQGPVNRKRRRRRPGPAETKGPRAAGRRGSARRAGVLAAGGRMVQKEGQAALEEPQGSPNPAGVPGAPLEPPGAATGPVPGGEETDTETETALGSRRFLCGVVEGESRRRGRPGSPGAVWVACSEGGGGAAGLRGEQGTSPPPALRSGGGAVRGWGRGEPREPGGAARAGSRWLAGSALGWQLLAGPGTHGGPRIPEGGRGGAAARLLVCVKRGRRRGRQEAFLCGCLPCTHASRAPGAQVRFLG